MAILGHGIDLFDVSRMARELGDPGFAASIFTPAEIAYCAARQYPAEHFAARFAAKEALLKALSAAGGESGWYWTEIEVTHAPAGAPHVALSGRLQAQAEALGVRRIHLSLTHTRELAMASVFIES